MKNAIKKITPLFILNWYHKALALLAMIIYGSPANKMMVIGVTGTNGKSTVVNLIGQILIEDGNKVSWTATTNFYLNGQEWLNDKKMTMLGRWQTQKFLSRAVKAGCKYAIIETSSEGIKQFRHLGINYDFAVFTNLTPEHLESHGSFENYQKAKGQLFKHLTKFPKKKINGQLIDKTIIVNRDDQHADYFLNFPADKKLTYSINQPSDFQATAIKLQSNGTTFDLRFAIRARPARYAKRSRAGDSRFARYKTNLLGQVNVYNCLAAITACKQLNITDDKIKEALLKYHGVPGRFEFIDEGQPFKVMVDYAPEPESIKHLYETLKLFKFNKIIHLLGSCGGGRDKARRPVLGKLAAQNADVVIVTNEDPYDENPQEIIDEVTQGAIDNGKILNQNLFKILDRKEAIKKALLLAKENDLVLLTGKGCEQFICIAHGQKIKWDERKVVKGLLEKII